MSKSPSACRAKGSKSRAAPSRSTARTCAFLPPISAAFANKPVKIDEEGSRTGMKISYRGMKKGLPAMQQAKLDAKLGKLSKMLDGPAGEKEAHVVVTTERHLSNAEITL